MCPSQQHFRKLEEERRQKIIVTADAGVHFPICEVFPSAVSFDSGVHDLDPISFQLCLLGSCDFLPLLTSIPGPRRINKSSSSNFPSLGTLSQLLQIELIAFLLCASGFYSKTSIVVVITLNGMSMLQSYISGRC